MTIRKIASIAAAGALALTLTACSSNDADGPEESTTATSPQGTTDTAPAPSEEVAETAELTDLSKGVEGQVGFRHGMDCQDVDDCSVNFTVESLDRMEACEGSPWGEQPADTHLVKATVLVETKPSATSYNPGEFPVWADWSALDKDGVNQELPASSWCSLTNNEHQWMEAMHTGDTERRVHVMDVPDGTTKIRLTETLTGARWEFPAP